MSYASALLWFLFLMLSSAEAVLQAVVGPDYFAATKSLFPAWPVWQPLWALVLLATTGVLLFLPKMLSYLLIVLKTRRSHLFGGPLRLLASILLEVIFSALLAPIRMLFHSKFVCITLLGRKIGWGSQQRDDRPTTWGEAARFHAGGALFGLLWGGVVWLYSPHFFWWIAPIVVPIVLSMPLSVLTSHDSPGRWLRRRRLLMIPEESAPAEEIRDVVRFTATMEAAPVPLDLPREAGFLRALLDPGVNALRRALTPPRPHPLAPHAAARRDQLVERVLLDGPDDLTQDEKMLLLRDPDRLFLVHRTAWTADNGSMRRQWIDHRR